MVDYVWSEIVSRAAERSPVSILLTPTEAQLLNDLLTNSQLAWRWLATASEWDVVDALISEVNTKLLNNILVGTVLFSAGDVPENCLLCDGTQYAKADYPALYAALAATYIVDADYFEVPNLIDRFPLGSDETGLNGGSATHTLTSDEMPVHTHGYLTPTVNVDVESVGVPDPTGVGLPLIQVYQTASAGNGQSHNNMPPYLEMLPCIVAY